jgi:hypothetical protein
MKMLTASLLALWMCGTPPLTATAHPSGPARRPSPGAPKPPPSHGKPGPGVNPGHSPGSQIRPGYSHRGHTYCHRLHRGDWHGWGRRWWYPALGCWIYWSAGDFCWYRFDSVDGIYVPCDDLTDGNLDGPVVERKTGR